MVPIAPPLKSLSEHPIRRSLVRETDLELKTHPAACVKNEVWSRGMCQERTACAKKQGREGGECSTSHFLSHSMRPLGCILALVSVGDTSGDLLFYRASLPPGIEPTPGSRRAHLRRGRREPGFGPIPGCREATITRQISPRSCHRLMLRPRCSQGMLNL